MKYYQHGETGRVVATEAELIGEWYEIEKDQYEEALHPLSRPTTGAVDLANESAENEVDPVVEALRNLGDAIAPPNH